MKNFRWFIFATLYLFPNGTIAAEVKFRAEQTPLMQCIMDTAASESFHGTIIAGRVGGPPEAAAFNNDGVPGQPVTLNTRMSIGSMGKMFTAVAISQLADQGMLSFTDSVRKYIPDLSEEYDDVTLHHLLTHTGGTGNYFTPANIPKLRNAQSASDLVPMIAAMPLQSAPGEKFSYSNSGFALLGAVIEQVTGDNYANYLKKNIFEPTGMHDTSLEADNNTAIAYTRFRPDRQPGTRTRPSNTDPLHQSPMNGIRGMAAGGGYSTVNDLYRFGVALVKNRLTKPETTMRILSAKPGTQMPTSSGGIAHYGYGFFISKEGDRVGHGGGAPGINGELRIRLESGWVIAALSNLDPPMATGFALALEKRLLAKCDGPET